MQFAKNLLLRRRRRKGRRKGEEGKILGLGTANAANSAQNTIPLDAYFIHCTKPINTTSHFIQRGGGGTLCVKDRAREMLCSYSGCYFICPWAILVAASTHVSSKYCLTRGSGPAGWQRSTAVNNRDKKEHTTDKCRDKFPIWHKWVKAKHRETKYCSI